MSAYRLTIRRRRPHPCDDVQDTIHLLAEITPGEYRRKAARSYEHALLRQVVNERRAVAR